MQVTQTSRRTVDLRSRPFYGQSLKPLRHVIVGTRAEVTIVRLAAYNHVDSVEVCIIPRGKKCVN